MASHFTADYEVKPAPARTVDLLSIPPQTMFEGRIHEGEPLKLLLITALGDLVDVMTGGHTARINCMNHRVLYYRKVKTIDISVVLE